MNYTDIYKERYLAHHGVKGMKWGVRRMLRKAADHKDRRDYNRVRKTSVFLNSRKTVRSATERYRIEKDLKKLEKRGFVITHKPIRKMSNKEIRAVVDHPNMRATLNSISKVERENRKALALVTLTAVGSLSYMMYKGII